MMIWRTLIGPDYTLTFLEAFLISALPALGFASAVGNSGIMAVHAWPSGPAIFAAILIGTLNGIRAIKTLRTPPPA